MNVEFLKKLKNDKTVGKTRQEKNCLIYNIEIY